MKNLMKIKTVKRQVLTSIKYNNFKMQQIMNQNFFNLYGRYNEITLSKLTQLMSPPDLIDIDQRKIENTIDRTFQLNGGQILIEENIAVLKQIKMEHKKLYEIAEKVVNRKIKHYMLTIQCILKMQKRPNNQESFKKIGKMIKEGLINIKRAVINIEDLLHKMFIFNKWNCQCLQSQCKNKHIEQNLTERIYDFVIDNNQIIHDSTLLIDQQTIINSKQLQHIKNRAISDRNRQSKIDYIKIKDHFQCILIQKSDDKKNTKKRKKNKNKKKVQQPILSQEKVEISKDQSLDLAQVTQIDRFLQQFEIDELDRVPCLVTQDWIEKIKSKNYFKYKQA